MQGFGGDKVNLSNNVKKIRKLKKLTLKETAKKTGVSHQMISQIETGKKRPSLETLIKIADAFDCSLDDLVR